MSDPSSPNPQPTEDDARFDEMARAAGRALRRPAPADGLNSVRRSHRHRQVVNVATATVGAAALIVATVALLGRHQTEHHTITASPTTLATTPTTVGPTIVATAALPVSTPATSPTTILSTTPATVSPTTDTTTTTTTAPDLAAPTAVYTATGFGDTTASVFDPATGNLIRTEPVTIDGGPPAVTAPASVVNAAGTISYALTGNGLSDQCGQSQLTVVGAAAALPALASAIAISADGQTLAVEHGTCPQTVSTDPGPVAFVNTTTIFDADHPDRPGRDIATHDGAAIQSLQFTADANRLLVNYGELIFDVLDVATGATIDVTDGCTNAVPAGGVTFDIFGGSSIAFTAVCGQFGPTSTNATTECATGNSVLINGATSCGPSLTVVVVDLTTNARLERQVPNTGVGASAILVVDTEQYTTPDAAWYTLVASSTPSLADGAGWIGHGTMLRPIPAYIAASFTPYPARQP